MQDDIVVCNHGKPVNDSYNAEIRMHEKIISPDVKTRLTKFDRFHNRCCEGLLLLKTMTRPPSIRPLEANIFGVHLDDKMATFLCHSLPYRASASAMRYE